MAMDGRPAVDGFPVSAYCSCVVLLRGFGFEGPCGDPHRAADADALDHTRTGEPVDGALRQPQRCRGLADGQIPRPLNCAGHKRILSKLIGRNKPKPHLDVDWPWCRPASTRPAA